MLTVNKFDSICSRLDSRNIQELRSIHNNIIKMLENNRDDFLLNSLLNIVRDKISYRKKNQSFFNRFKIA